MSNLVVSFSMKKGRVVILTSGRMAGKKAVIVKQNDDGKKVSSVASLTLGVSRVGQKVCPCSRRWH